MYEVEIKTLLITEARANELKRALRAMYPHMSLVGRGRQLNHYFDLPEDKSALLLALSVLVPAAKHNALNDIFARGGKMSLRTRDADGTVILVLKASVGDGTSSNGVRRLEFESVVPGTLAGLDAALVSAGASYQAKWSREREEYAADGIHVCIDRNAGYGYLAEFEKVVPEEGMIESAHRDLLEIMSRLGAEELPQDRLERMFAHYNAHWAEYYGTDKTFIIE